MFLKAVTVLISLVFSFYSFGEVEIIEKSVNSKDLTSAADSADQVTGDESASGCGVVSDGRNFCQNMCESIIANVERGESELTAESLMAGAASVKFNFDASGDGGVVDKGMALDSVLKTKLTLDEIKLRFYISGKGHIVKGCGAAISNHQTMAGNYMAQYKAAAASQHALSHEYAQKASEHRRSALIAENLLKKSVADLTSKETLTAADVANAAGGVMDVGATINAAKSALGGESVAEGKQKAWVKPALMGAAAVGGALLLNKVMTPEDPKDTSKGDQAKRDEANGIVEGPNGERIACKTSGNVGREECRNYLKNYCATADAGNAGCQAFHAVECREDNKNTNYCVFASTRSYCAQGGTVISQSPGCQWMKDRPSTCNGNFDNIDCLAKTTPDALKLTCPNFPNDPLCQAQGSGAIVTQPSTPSPTPTSPSTPTEGVILSSVSPASSVVTSNSMLSGSSNLTRSLCRSGQLYDCGADRLPSSY